jgi:hypothetical protein
LESLELPSVSPRVQQGRLPVRKSHQLQMPKVDVAPQSTVSTARSTDELYHEWSPRDAEMEALQQSMGLRDEMLPLLKAMDRMDAIKGEQTLLLRHVASQVPVDATGRVSSSDFSAAHGWSPTLVELPTQELRRWWLVRMMPAVEAGVLGLDRVRRVIKSWPRSERREAWLMTTRASPPRS